MSARSLVPALVFAALPLTALAEPAESSGEVVVTATRLPSPSGLQPDAQVITSDDIARRQAALAIDVLTTLPGVQVYRDSAFGGFSSVSLRGASSDKTLVLIDGAPVNDPTAPAGGFDISTLDLADVDRIEVLTGPQGSLWGSDAIGGVIAVTTREPTGWRASGEAGAFGTVRANGSAGGADKRAALGASVGWMGSGGISKADARDGNPERDGWRNFTAQANARLDPTPALSLDGRLRWNQSHVELDSFGGPTGVIDGPDWQNQWLLSGFARARLDGPFGVHQELRADGMRMSRTNDSFFGGDGFTFTARGSRLDLRWTAERTGLGPNAILVGVEQETSYEDTGDGRQSQRNLAGFAVWRFTPSDRGSITASLRRDQPSGLDGVTSVRASGVLRLAWGFSANASFGQGFKAPSLFQRTYPCFECEPPGPASGLKPERAEGGDAGLVWRSGGGAVEARLTGYRLLVRDEILYEFPQGYVNIARARSQGIEAEADLRPLSWLLVKASYSYTDSRDLGTGERLLKIPLNSGSVSVDVTRGRLTAGAVLRAQSSAPDVYGEIRPFAVADLTAAYALTPRVQLTARIENVTDAHYQRAFGYGEPGFGLFAGIRLKD
jgi:vitamin B12 transporter